MRPTASHCRGKSALYRGAVTAALLVVVSIAGCAPPPSLSRPEVPPLPESMIERRQVTLTAAPGVNSPGDDFGVAMPLDTTLMLFTSNRGSSDASDHDIYVTRLLDGRWTPPKHAVEVNNSKSNGMPSITPGGETLYFTGCDYGLGECDLYSVSTGPRGSVPAQELPWMIPTNMGLNVNGAYWDSQGSVAADGSVLYFSSNRPGGLGGRDIWLVRRERDGSWGRPVNAGPRINTAFDEVTPWLTPDGRTLLFSSNGHPGLGGFDVFAATETLGGIAVSNLGTPINSSSDEIAFSVSDDGTHSWVASNRPGGTGGYDIYRVDPVPVLIDPLMVVRGRVSDSTGNGILATIDVSDLAAGTLKGVFSTDPNSGMYAIVLPRGGDYSVTAHVPDGLFASKRVTVATTLEHDSSATVDLQIPPMSGSMRLLVFFAPGGRNLERESVPELSRLVELLQSHQDLHIEVNGFAFNRRTGEANLQLSRERAQMVKNYLVGNRVAADRITVRGLGSTTPTAGSNPSERPTGDARVEVRILDGSSD